MATCGQATSAFSPTVNLSCLIPGDRETDLAMTELFGGFSGEFYQAYKTVFPLDSGFPVRKHLYHLLNHLNLFGSAYLSGCESTLDRLLAEAD